MIDIETYIRDALTKAIRSTGIILESSTEIDLAVPKKKGHGDLASNIAFLIAKKAKQNPRKLAENIIQHIETETHLIESVTVAGAGFINFSFSPNYLHETLRHILKLSKEYGRSNSGRGRKTQVEFVSANPTGPLTIGHGRQAVIGDVISRLLEATGYQVFREYYFNNAGRQMRILGDSVRLRYKELLGNVVNLPEEYYQGEYIKDIARLVLEEKGDALKDDADVIYFQKLAERTIFEDINMTLEKLGIVFDEYYNEQSLYDTGKIDRVIEALREKNLAYDKDGAVWFRTTQFDMDQDRVIVKSTGEPTYRLPDIAYHKDKLDRGFDLIVDIFGADHMATYPDVQAGIEALGYDSSKVKVLIHQFVTLMEGKEKVKMSTRKANFITLDELMDEVGVDVTRYFYINRSMSSHLNFDLTLAKTQSDENPVYYVQYAHARICSILNHARQEGLNPEEKADLSLLQTPEEINLIKILLLYPRIVGEAAGNFEPHRIPSYLEEVATVYHRFQHAGKRDASLRVVSLNKPLSLARLALCRAVRVVLGNGLDLLGISKPEKM